MKNAILLLVLCLPSTIVLAQNKIHQRAVDTFFKQLNGNDFEGIYQSFSVKMQNSKPKKHFFAVFNKVRSEFGQLRTLDVLQYRENSRGDSRASYTGKFENGTLTIKITVDSKGEIIGLYFTRNDFI